MIMATAGEDIGVGELVALYIDDATGERILLPARCEEAEYFVPGGIATSSFRQGDVVVLDEATGKTFLADK